MRLHLFRANDMYNSITMYQFEVGSVLTYGVPNFTSYKKSHLLLRTFTLFTIERFWCAVPP